jgi:hypothetical protein
MPTQTELEFRGRGGGLSQCDLLEREFRARPGEAISYVTLARIMGGHAVNSRVADLRRRKGMNIINTTRIDHETGKCLSWYRFEDAIR